MGSEKIPKVSIITVYYNRDYCVTQSVQSLLSQSLQDFELLLVNDGSTDDTLHEFEKFDDPRVKIISHSNIGFTNSIRRAVDEARAEYIAVHGSGDYSFPQRVERQAAFLDNNKDYVVVASRFERVNEETLEKIEDSPFMGDLDYNDFIKNCRIMHGAVMFRKSVYQQVGGYEAFFKTSQDWDLFLRFLKIGKGKVLNEILYRQYKRSDAVAAKTSSYEKVFKTYALVVRLAKESENRTEILKVAYAHGLDNVITHKNRDFQRLYVGESSRLVRMGRHADFLESAKKFRREDLSFALKIKYYVWLTIAHVLHASKLDARRVRASFLKIKNLKDRVAESIYKMNS